MSTADDPPPQLPEVRPAPEQPAPSAAQALLARLDLAAPTTRGGGRGEIGPDATVVSVLADQPAPVLATLRDSGFECRPLRHPSDVGALDPEHSIVLAVDADDSPGRLLGEVNDAAIAALVPWLPVSAYDGAVVHVGPLVLPGVTACFACARRRLGSAPGYASLYDSVIAGAPAVPMPRAMRTWAYSLATLVLLQWLGHRVRQLPGELFTLDPAELQVHRARVSRVPRCPSCSPAVGRP